MLRRSHATWDTPREKIIVDNADGFTAYHGPGAWLSTFDTGTNVKRNGYPVQSVFAERGDAVVVGSEIGKIYVFSLRGGSPRDVLEHADVGRVLRVDVSSLTI
jgi:hypothetical protein